MTTKAQQIAKARCELRAQGEFTLIVHNDVYIRDDGRVWIGGMTLDPDVALKFGQWLVDMYKEQLDPNVEFFRDLASRFEEGQDGE
jgi:hypothetical protein